MVQGPFGFGKAIGLGAMQVIAPKADFVPFSGGKGRSGFANILFIQFMKRESCAEITFYCQNYIYLKGLSHEIDLAFDDMYG